MVVKAQYLCYMQVDTNCYWNQQPKQHVITVPTRTILHPKLEVNSVIDFRAIPTSVCTRTQEKTSISMQPICLTDSEYNYILEEICRQEKLSLKEMYKFIVMTRKINMSILNEYYMFLSFIDFYLFICSA